MAPCRCNFSTTSCHVSLSFHAYYSHINMLPRNTRDYIKRFVSCYRLLNRIRYYRTLGEYFRIRCKRQSVFLHNRSTMFYIFRSRTFSALGLFLIRGRESVSPNRVDEMRNHREPPYSIQEAGANELFVPLLSLSRPAHPPSLLSFSLILRWIRRCPVHWHLSKDSDFSLRTWQLRARGAKRIHCHRNWRQTSFVFLFFFPISS